MNSHLQRIHDLIKQSAFFSAEDKSVLEKEIKDTEKELEILSFKLDRTEKVNRTTAILLEETIQELEQKRKAVELQNRELEIEAALERVRVVAMGMIKDDDIRMVCEALYKELKQLGFKNIRNAQGGIIDAENKTFKEYSYSDYGSSTTGVITKYTDDPLSFELVTEIQQSKDAFFKKQISGDEFESWRRWRLESGRPDDPLLEQASSTWFYIYSIGTGGIGISTLDAITEEQQLLLKRFKNVFELTYTRFHDLQKAEAQAREAQIEVAVERVRAKALAMHKSEDLHSVVVTLKKELTGLRIPNITAATMYLAQDDGSIRILDLSDTGGEGEDNPQLEVDKIFRLEETDPDLWIRRMWKRSENYFVLEADEADFVRVVQWIRTFDPAGAEIAEKIIKEKSIKKAWLPTVKLEKGRLNIDLLEPPTDEIKPILLKMGAAFDLAYRRFLDLQKAEAQARESQIELGLERVRARAMGMQRSDELKELIATVSIELSRLDITLDRCFIITYDIQTMGSTWWMSNPELPGEPIGLFVKYHEHSPYLAHITAWKERRVKWQYILEGEVKIAWDRFLFAETELSQLPDFVIANMRSKEKVYLSSSFNNFGYLTLATLAPLSDEQFDIMLRFAKVFDLTYTRFMDIQKAEAQ